MARARRFKRAEKEIVSGNNLNPEQWLFVEMMITKMRIVNKETGKEKLIDKNKVRKKRSCL